MPFTFSHPAIVLPLNYLPRKWISITGLVIGSLMPDLEAYLRFTSEKSESHTWTALFWFCIPLGTLLSFLYHLVVRNPLLYHLPQLLQEKLLRYTHFNWPRHFKNNLLVILLSFFIGGASHLLWDSFSHFDGLLHKLNPAWLGNTRVLGYNIEIPYLIQYINSLVGLLVILFAIWQIPADNKNNTNKRWWSFWVKVVFISVPVFLIRWAVMDRYKLDDVIVSLSTALMLGLLITSAWYRNRYYKKDRSLTQKENV